MKKTVILFVCLLIIGIEAKSEVKITPLRYEIISVLPSGLFIVEHNNKYTYMDTLGNLITHKWYQTVSTFYYNQAIVSDKDWNCYFIDKTGKVVKKIEGMYRPELSWMDKDFSSGLKPFDVRTLAAENFIETEDYYVFTVPYEASMNIEGKTIRVKNSVFGFSKKYDDGKIWSFIDNSDISKEILTSSFSDIAEKLDLSKPVILSYESNDNPYGEDSEE